jgi:hypothetical protein
VSELRTEYEGRVVFVVVTPERTLAGDDVARYGLGTHGLVAFASDGTVVATIPGHDFGRAEIEEVIRQVLEQKPAG